MPGWPGPSRPATPLSTWAPRSKWSRPAATPATQLAGIQSCRPTRTRPLARFSRTIRTRRWVAPSRHSNVSRYQECSGGSSASLQIGQALKASSQTRPGGLLELDSSFTPAERSRASIGCSASPGLAPRYLLVPNSGFRVSGANRPAESLTTPGLGLLIPTVRSPAAGLSRNSSRTRSTATGDLVRIEREAAGQVAVGIALSEEILRPSLERGDRIGAGGEAQRRLLLTCEVDQRIGELRGIADLLPVHTLPGGDGLLAPFGVVLDRGLGVLGRLRREQFGAEEAGLDQHRADSERSDLGGQ